MKRVTARAIVRPYRKPERYEVVRFEIHEDGSIWYLTKYRNPERVERIRMANKKRLISDKQDRCAVIELSEKTIWVKKDRAQTIGLIPKDPESPQKQNVEIKKVDRLPSETITLTIPLPRLLTIRKKAAQNNMAMTEYILSRLPRK